MISIEIRRWLWIPLITSLVLLQGCSGEAPPEKEPAPDFKLTLFDGDTFQLSEHKGKPVLINFLASWCIPCREEIPVLNQVYREYGPKNVAFAGIAIDDTEENAKEFVEKFELGFPAGIDKTGEIKDAYGLYGVPTTIFIDDKGIIKYLHPGSVTEILLKHELDKLL